MPDAPSDALILAYRACFARIAARAAELMVEHDEWSVPLCVEMAKVEEVILYGVPTDKPAPVGILGKSPLQSLKEKLK